MTTPDLGLGGARPAAPSGPATDQPGGADQAAERPAGDGTATRHASWGITLACIAVLVVPLVVAAVALHGKPWFPTGDLAQAEMRLVGFWSHPPLIGPAGRIGTTVQGSHPGPLMFWFAWPVYRLFGNTSWGYEVSVLVLAAVWIALIAVFARRRGGLGLLLTLLAGLAIVARSYHADTLSQPWNPFMPLLAFFLFLVLVWSVLCDDLVALPVAVVIGSYCLQSEIEYSLMVVAMLALAVGWQVGRFVRHRRDPASPVRDQVRWLVVAVVAGVLVWIPPVIDQVRHDPGNLTILYRYFSNPPETSIGYVTGLKVMLVQLNPWGNWLTGGWITTGGTPVPGALLLVLWAVLAVVVSRRDGRLLRLNLVIGAGVVLAAASAAQIFGLVWGYLVEWFWALTALTALSICWSVVLLLRPHLTADTLKRLRLVPGVALVGIAALFAVQASGIEPTAYYFPRQEAVLSAQTLAHVDHGKRYLVLWEDPIGLGGTGFGLMLQLERNGVRNGAPPQFRAGVQDRRIMVPGQYDSVLHLVTGPKLVAWRAEPQAREVACVDLRSTADRAASHRLEASLAAELRRRGLPDLAQAVHDNLFALTLNPALPADLRPQATRLVNFGEAVAVFETPAAVLTPSPPAVAAGARASAAGAFGSAPTCP